MTPALPESFEPILRPLFAQRPIAQSMSALVVDKALANQALIDQIQAMLDTPPLQGRADVAAGVWLYVDELAKAHHHAKSMDTPAGAFWHAIMHRREGDFANSRYWYRRAGHHPAMSRIQISGGGAGAGTSVGGYDPHRFVDRIERAHQRGDGGHIELISLQRREWVALFEWCMENM